MKIALDLDGVIADIAPTFRALHPEWNTKEYEIQGLDLTRIPYLNLPVLDRPEFDIVCYITARPDWAYLDTVKWLAKHNFPKRLLLFTSNKLQAMYEWEVDILIDDKLETWHEINQTEEKRCFLYSQPWNMGAKTTLRINNLKEFNNVLS